MSTLHDKINQRIELLTQHWNETVPSRVIFARPTASVSAAMDALLEATEDTIDELLMTYTRAVYRWVESLRR